MQPTRCCPMPGKAPARRSRTPTSSRAGSKRAAIRPKPLPISAASASRACTACSGSPSPMPASSTCATARRRRTRSPPAEAASTAAPTGSGATIPSANGTRSLSFPPPTRPEAERSEYLLWRDDRKQQIALPRAAGVNRVAGADIVVGRIVPIHRGADAVAGLNVQPDAVSLFEHHAARPDLELAFDDLAGLQPSPLVVRVVRAIRQALARIELAVSCAQPALGDRHLIEALLSDLPDVFAIGPDVPDRGEDVHVLGCAGHPQHQRHRAGDLGVLLER